MMPFGVGQNYDKLGVGPMTNLYLQFDYEAIIFNHIYKVIILSHVRNIHGRRRPAD